MQVRSNVLMWAEYRSARSSSWHWRAHSALSAVERAGGKHKTRALWTARHGMQTLIALLVAAAAACAIARPPGPTAAPLSLQVQNGPQMVRVPLTSSHDYLVDYILAKFILPHRLGYEESPRVPQLSPQNDWLNKEIDRINQMDDEVELPNPYEEYVPSWIQREPYVQRMLPAPVPVRIQEPFYTPETIRTSFEDLRPLNIPAPPLMVLMPDTPQEVKREPETMPAVNPIDINRKRFALTPMDKEYYKHSEEKVHRSGIVKSKAVEPARAPVLLEPPRQTRQNPNLSKQKHLLEPDIGKLKIGLTNKDYRLPVSLLPTNLRWLKLTKPDENIDDYERSHEEERGKQVQVAEAGGGDPAESIYGVAVIAAVGAALTMAIIGFGFGWYTLSKKAKAAADVDYPAYGVTGPTVDTSGDRKLAHSAHMYHYQHQKQQIIAMERNGLEQRAGSVSDPESEEENEEGDYTVYECPGFATTGDMEVKNPLFSEDPTPTAAGKCEVVKPQPKD